MQPLRAWLALAMCMIACVAPPTARANDEACPLRRIASLPMKTDVVGRPLIPARVAGRPAMFLVDTGAVSTMLSHDAAREMNLPAAPVKPRDYVFVNGASAERTARARFELGRLPFGAFTFLVTPASLKIPGASGALGPDVMRNFDVELDFAAGRFNLFSPDHCDGAVVYWTNKPYSQIAFTLDGGGHLTTTALLDGHTVDVLIDTGAAATNITLEDASAEFGIGPHTAGVERIDDGDSDPRGKIYAYSFQSLDLEGISINRPQVLIRPDRTGIPQSGMRPELILGMTVLSKLHLYLSYRERKMFITAADAR